MNWSDYEAAWKRQEPPKGAITDIADLRATFEAKRRKLTASLLLRDALEGFGGMLMAGIFVTVAWRMGRNAWPILIGSAVIFAVALVFVVDFFRARRMRVSANATMLAQLDAVIGELRHQRRLLARIGWWYFLPYLFAIALIGNFLSRANQKTMPPGFLVILLTTPATLFWILLLASVTGCAIFWAWRSSKRAVTTRIDPRIIELQKLRRELIGEE
jgi:hypothetical protein